MKRDVLYEGHILNLVKLADRWEVIEHAAAVCILALKDGQVLGVQQMRPAIGQETWELPAGLIDAGESPEDAARRELAEETQLGGQLDLLTQVYSSPGFSDEKIYIFEATELEFAHGELDDGEELRVVWRDLAELWHDIKQGRVASSAPSVLALSIARGRSS